MDISFYSLFFFPLLWHWCPRRPHGKRAGFSCQKKSNIQLCLYGHYCPFLVWGMVSSNVCKASYRSPLMTSQFRNFPGRAIQCICIQCYFRKWFHRFDWIQVEDVLDLSKCYDSSLLDCVHYKKYMVHLLELSATVSFTCAFSFLCSEMAIYWYYLHNIRIKLDGSLPIYLHTVILPDWTFKKWGLSIFLGIHWNPKQKEFF